MCGNVQGRLAGWQMRAGGDACPRSSGAQPGAFWHWSCALGSPELVLDTQTQAARVPGDACLCACHLVRCRLGRGKPAGGPRGAVRALLPGAQALEAGPSAVWEGVASAQQLSHGSLFPTEGISGQELNKSLGLAELSERECAHWSSLPGRSFEIRVVLGCFLKLRE